MEKEEHDQIIFDRFLSVQYSLWNSLITFNSILLGIISILYVLNPAMSKCFVLWLFTSCSVSILLIILNYLMCKYFYKYLAKHNNDNDDVKYYGKKNYKHFSIGYKIQNFNEIVVILIIIFNLIKIAFWIAFHV